MMKRSPSRENAAWRSAAATAALLGVALLPLFAQQAAAQPESVQSCMNRCVNDGECAPNPFTPCLPHVYRTDEDVESESPPYDDFIQILPVAGTDTLRLFITADGTGLNGPNDGSGDTGGGTPCVAGPGYGPSAPPGPLGLDSDHLCAFSVIIEIPDVCENLDPTNNNACLAGSPLVQGGQFTRFELHSALAANGGLVTVPAAGDFDPGVTRFGINFVNPSAPLEPGAEVGGTGSAGQGSASPMVEDFEAAFPAWETGWLGANSNLANVYAGPSGGSSSDRGNNPDGLWLSDGDGIVSDDVVDIAFDPAFGASLTSLSLDVAGHTSSRLQIYDSAGATLLDVNPITPTNGATSDPGSYVNYGTSSSNGIGGFRLLRLAEQIEGNTGIDNVVVNGGTDPWAGVVVHELGLLDVEVFRSNIEVWVRQGDAIRSANAKAVELGTGQTLQNVSEDRMSAHAIAVPEPGVYLSLFSTLAGLVGLHHLRSRRR